MDGAFKTYTSLRENLNQADLDFLIFGQRNKTGIALCNLPLKKIKATFYSHLYKRKRQHTSFQDLCCLFYIINSNNYKFEEL
ncbi:MAG TPA: hypothetical protein DCS73_13885 [Roseburia sp.]|nr:hypothetical protein [Roseburia sp.]